MAYPASLDSFTANTDGVDEVVAADVNELQAAIVAIETELGTDPAGSQTDVKTRLANAMNAAGYIKGGPGTTLTISSGAITVTGNYHKVETQASAASDDLDTISGGATGLILFLQSVADARNVVIKHNTGNIYCTGAKDITLDTNYDIAFLVYDNANTRWIAGTFLPTGTYAKLAVANNFTANQTLTDVDIVLGTTTGTKIGTATTQKLGFYNVTPIVQPVALTTQLTDITHTAPGTPDYAIQDLTDSGCFGFVTKDEGNTVLSVILNLQTRVAELEDKLQALGLLA